MFLESSFQNGTIIVSAYVSELQSQNLFSGNVEDIEYSWMGIHVDHCLVDRKLKMFSFRMDFSSFVAFCCEISDN